MYLVTKILFTKVYSTLVMETGVKIKLQFFFGGKKAGFAHGGIWFLWKDEMDCCRILKRKWEGNWSSRQLSNRYLQVRECANSEQKVYCV